MADCEQNLLSNPVTNIIIIVIIFVGVIYGIYKGLLYFGVLEGRTFPNVTTDMYISRANSEFDSNRTLSPKIEDFDAFKSKGYGDIDSSVSYTRNKILNRPYSVIASTSINPGTVLNSTILPDDRAVETVQSLAPINDMNNVDVTASLSGINGSAEASIRESMLNSTYELRKNRK
jgi:hypothetical protein